MDSGALGASCCITESLCLACYEAKAGCVRPCCMHANCTGAAQESQLSHIEFFKRRSLNVAVFSPFFSPPTAECLETCNGFKIAPFGDAADAAMGDT